MMRYFLFLFVFSACFAEDPKPFVIGKLKGQLGNQMFEIAAALSLAQDNGAEAYFPDLSEQDNFNIPNNAKKIFYKLRSSRPEGEVQYYYQEPAHNYHPIPFVPDMEIAGFYQSEKYFKHNFDKIKPYFEAPQNIIDDLMRDYGDIIGYPKTVSLHVRTYFGEHNSHSVMNFCGIDYITKAMGQFPDEDTLFVVFSDQIWWVKMVLRQSDRNIIYIEGQDYLHDFYLMSLCKDNIISNSTFSWWAAYLNANPEKIVVAPVKWFSQKKIDSSDLIPEDWIQIDW